MVRVWAIQDLGLRRYFTLSRTRENLSAGYPHHQQPYGVDGRYCRAGGVKEHCEVILSTDSQYVRQGITQWIHNWKKRGWKTADKKPVKKVDLWQRLDAALGQHQIKWEWVKGHAGHPENERCDELARAAAMNPTLEDTGYQVEV